MYCNKCGRYHETEGILCPECQQAQQNVSKPAVAVIEKTATPVVATAEKPSNRQGIKAIIFGGVGFMLGLIAYIVSIVAMVEIEYSDLGYDFAVLAIFLALATIPFMVMGIVFGVQAIKVFKAAGASGQKRPIPGFIMGIGGIVFAGTSAIVAVCALFFAMLVSAI
ncbi:MAG: hypothetical protein IKC47_03600 [Clostridia bacterium]|nr:hypothetical protein [Clostridia bacterium]